MDRFRLAAPLLRALDAESAHAVTLRALALGLGPREAREAESRLALTVWGLRFPNPLGLAAGFDKNAQVVRPMLALGFGFVEAGTVTPRPQVGNPRPRIFRLPDEHAVINRIGFANDGMTAIRARLARARRSALRGPVGVNIGKNKDAEDAAADYATVARALAPTADYLVVNVSSPNTPGLRALQDPRALTAILASVRAAVREVAPDRPPPVLVKIAPDLGAEDVAALAKLANDGALDGLVVSNTTIARPPGLRGRHAGETGGLSGRPLFTRSTEVLSTLYRLTGGQVPLIGVGGIASAADAYAKIRAGASLVQLYTALIYQGPALVRAIKAGLVKSLDRDGFASIQEAIGADHR